MAKSNKRIAKPKIDNSIKKPDIPTNNGFSFCSVYQWLRGTDSLWKRQQFTNLCRNDQEFAKEAIYIFDVLVPLLYRDFNSIFSGRSYQFPHCHPISNPQKELCIEIAEQLHGRKFDTYDSDSISWWQLGITGSCRIIGLYDSPNNNFFPLFTDRHHLLYPDQNYNQKDIGRYKFNPIHS